MGTPAAYGSSRLGVELQLQLQFCTTATARPDLSHICDLCHSLWQYGTLNPMSEARDQTHIFTELCQVLNTLSRKGNSRKPFSLLYLFLK